MHSKIKELSEKYFEDTVSIRKYLHQHPEVSYKEFETTKYIKNKLKEWGIPFESPLETGCVGIIEGERASDKVIALRADIDALPIQETGAAKQGFLSKNEGVAHCCGHDAHTANLLTAARILNELKSEIEGKVLLVFQPGEEKLPGGGKLLSETGFLQDQNVQSIYGLHTSPNHAPGTIATKTGPLMAAPDEFEIEIIGKGGHAAKAHEAIDPVVLSAQFINAAQTIASRSVDPTEPVVVTIGRIEGGTAHNIIPEKVKLWGTARTLTPETADLVENRLETLLKGITASAGGSYNFAFNKGYPAVINTEKEAETVLRSMRNLFGDERAIEMKRPIMAGEDFAFYQQYFPGAFYFVGSGSPASDSQYPWHHPKYNVDHGFFKVATPMMVSLVFEH
ncbi:M20 metallopeptidase family protein [Gracilimonas mengyeensis]|uniref:Amidohydrolase/hippurate hydrolase n=1 Tax=Gracilimonas mengyeensis TaxID=1302730 RepID=A0A521FK46_9BACT|nr:amidohydrolase [Gracilimonas mengyeensis]SMO96583.1 amidohydrolase/hippurate hydrolase [Gracilimonas mengyeensis]